MYLHLKSLVFDGHRHRTVKTRTLRIANGHDLMHYAAMKERRTALHSQHLVDHSTCVYVHHKILAFAVFCMMSSASSCLYCECTILLLAAATGRTKVVIRHKKVVESMVQQHHHCKQEEWCELFRNCFCLRLRHNECTRMLKYARSVNFILSLCVLFSLLLSQANF